ncbi:MAG: metal ABC transporter ATP-binding protein [Actinobacteria bacterium]|nr:metal ABC transporter ATP-binding protein [Actinomycetota bacterium]
MSATIFIKNLSLKYGNNPILENISLTIEAGDLVMVIGPNGAGKTNLIKCMLGLIKPDSGTINIISAENQKSKRLKIGYVPQKPAFEKDFPATVLEVLDLMFVYQKYNRTEKRNLIESTISRLGIEKLLNEKIGDLSGGELQKVILARSILNTPDLLVLDELISGIDIANEAILYSMVNELNQKHATTVIMITHDINIVYKYARTVICLNKTLTCQGRPELALTFENLTRTYGDFAVSYVHKVEH